MEGTQINVSMKPLIFEAGENDAFLRRLK